MLSLTRAQYVCTCYFAQPTKVDTGFHADIVVAQEYNEQRRLEVARERRLRANRRRAKRTARTTTQRWRDLTAELVTFPNFRRMIQRLLVSDLRPIAHLIVGADGDRSKLKTFVITFVEKTSRVWTAALRVELSTVLPNTTMVANMNMVFSVEGLERYPRAPVMLEDSYSDAEESDKKRRHERAMATNAVVALKLHGCRELHGRAKVCKYNPSSERPARTIGKVCCAFDVAHTVPVFRCQSLVSLMTGVAVRPSEQAKSTREVVEDGVRLAVVEHARR